jgi:hypothetical protein
MKKGTRRLIACVTVIGALALAPAAFAQSTGTGYAGPGGVAGQVQSGGNGNNGNNNPGNQGEVAGQTAASQATDNSNGVLAFTGLDLALIAGGGLVLLAGGMALSRIVARHPA